MTEHSVCHPNESDLLQGINRRWWVPSARPTWDVWCRVCRSYHAYPPCG